MKVFIKHALNPQTVKRSIKVAIVVGTILGLINHSNALINGTFNTTRTIQVLTTYLVPYLVATYGAASQATASEMKA